MKNTIFISILVSFLLVSATSCNNLKSSSKSSKSFSTSDFSSLNIEVIGNVFYEQSDSFYVNASGNSNLVEGIKVSNNNGKLSIELTNKRRFSGNKKELIIRVGSPSLEAIHFNSVGTLSMEKRFKGEKLDITNSGVGHIQIVDCHLETFNLISKGVGTVLVKGSSNDATIHSEGIGEIDCSKLKALDTTVDCKGVGNISVYAESSIDISIKGIGNVKYYGNPNEIKENISGIGKAKNMN